ncbi:hypothetical protein HJG54_35265 (plasmid) [Leptolyngbya sp. NK1-12]|uniref:Uncharacterized protein n=1 Tax=Leptolyngbya sp. NK1-12 TaxID=2547451 RepID=A0AA96WNH0_9CYAN|nr:hypothetical protein [Leptolyngbya sp. NK1-12]WNZ28175.1 hypothetical protein HJG54_35265 [Leptolyngbya sp. NK1-12]
MAWQSLGEFTLTQQWQYTAPVAGFTFRVTPVGAPSLALRGEAAIAILEGNEIYPLQARPFPGVGAILQLPTSVIGNDQRLALRRTDSAQTPFVIQVEILTGSFSEQLQALTDSPEFENPPGFSSVQTLEEVESLVGAAITAHTSAPDPHTQYPSLTEVAEAITGAVESHIGTQNPHAQYVRLTEFQPLQSAVSQNTQDISELASDVDSNQLAIANLQTTTADLATNKAPLVHTHQIAQIDGLSTTLSDLLTDLGGKVSWSELEDPLNALDGNVGSLTTRLDSLETDFAGHTHPMNEVVGLQDALDSKAPVVHTHSTNQIDGLQAALDGKAPSSHTHSFGQYELVYGWFGISQSISTTLVDLQALDTTANNLKLVGFTYNITNRELITPAGGLYLVAIAGRVNDFTNVNSLRLSIFINNNEALRSINTYCAFRVTPIGANVPVRFQASCDQSRTLNAGAFIWRIGV